MIHIIGLFRDEASGFVRHVVLHSAHLVRCGYRDEQLMFVGDVETVKTVKEAAPVATTAAC